MEEHELPAVKPIKHTDPNLKFGTPNNIKKKIDIIINKNIYFGSIEIDCYTNYDTLQNTSLFKNIKTKYNFDTQVRSEFVINDITDKLYINICEQKDKKIAIVYLSDMNINLVDNIIMSDRFLMYENINRNNLNKIVSDVIGIDVIANYTDEHVYFKITATRNTKPKSQNILNKCISKPYINNSSYYYGAQLEQMAGKMQRSDAHPTISGIDFKTNTHISTFGKRLKDFTPIEIKTLLGKDFINNLSSKFKYQH
jgi:hypothetical protein